MKNITVGFVGGGRVVRIILEAWKRQGALPGKIVVHDCNAETLGCIGTQFPTVEADAGSPLTSASQDVVILALHPPVMGAVLAAIKASLKPDAIVVSLAPKLTIAKISELLGGFDRVVRVIPNAPSIINAGYNPVAFGSALSGSDKELITNLLSPLGECSEVAESKLEGYALLTGMGPTYIWFQLQALREVAAGFGLSESEVNEGMRRMVCGATRTLLQSGLTPAQVMDLVPVKPLAEMEPTVTEQYKTRLPALFAKIKP